MIASSGARTLAELTERISTVLFTGGYARDEFGAVADVVRPFGPGALFGGMLRDLYWAPPSAFRSDIDLVVSTDATNELASTLERLGGRRNRYGGVKVVSEKWTIDVWPLKETWGFREGHVGGGGFADLIHTTFFNWDAIVYHLDKKEFYFTPTYFAELEARLLEVNLEPNANPAGNVVRALRYLVLSEARLGPRLLRYVHDFLNRSVHDLQGMALPSVYAEYLGQSYTLEVMLMMRRHLEMSPDAPFQLGGRPSGTVPDLPLR